MVGRSGRRFVRVALAGVSVADAHVGAVIRALAAEEEAVVLTSDPKDMVVVLAPKAIIAIRI